jgi:putative phosphoesterase
MRIGVLSDTHLRSPDASLDHILENLFADTELILHAGDIVTRRVLDRLEESGVVAVCGNMDDYDVTESVPQMRIIPAAGKRIGLIHGWGSREGLAERVVARFGEDKPDLIVCGHSHVPFWGKVGGVNVFNPGSAAQNRYGGKCTVGLVEIHSGKFRTRFIELDR